MASPLEEGKAVFLSLFVSPDTGKILPPRDEINLATFVLETVVATADGRSPKPDAKEALTIIRDKTRSLVEVMRQISDFIARMGTSKQKQVWSALKADFSP